MSVSFKPVSRLSDCLDLASPPMSKKGNPRMAALGVDPVRVKEDCGVCLNHIESDERVKQLYCKHKFHQECIDPWLSNKPLCPNCRDNVRINAPHLVPAPAVVPVQNRGELQQVQFQHAQLENLISREPATMGELIGVGIGGVSSILLGSVINGCISGDTFGTKTAIAGATLIGIMGATALLAKASHKMRDPRRVQNYCVIPVFAAFGTAVGSISGQPALQSAATGAVYGLMHLTSLKVGGFLGKFAQFIADA